MTIEEMSNVFQKSKLKFNSNEKETSASLSAMAALENLKKFMKLDGTIDEFNFISQTLDYAEIQEKFLKMTELFTSNLKLFNDTTATALNNKQLFLNKLKNEKVHPDFIYLSETDQDLLASSACKILYLIKECEKFFSGLKLRLISENSLNSGKVVEMENMLESFKNIMWY